MLEIGIIIKTSLLLLLLLLGSLTRALIIATVGIFNGYDLCLMFIKWSFNCALKGWFVYGCLLLLSRYVINSL